MEKSPSPSDSRRTGSVPGASAPGSSAAPSPPPTGLKAAFRGSEDFLPREKLARLGPGALSDAELVAIFLRTGRPGRNVLQVADDLLRAYGGNLRLLSQESAVRLEGLGSIGRVRALELTAVFEFARRIAMHSQEAQPLLETPEQVARFVHGLVLQDPTESFYVLPLDRKMRLCDRVQRQRLCVSRGTADASPVHPRDVFREAVRVDACFVVVAHNHPSGDPTPSPQDLRITRALVDAGRVVGIPLVDHVVVGGLPDLRGPDGSIDTTRCFDLVPRFRSLRRTGAVDFDLV